LDSSEHLRWLKTYKDTNKIQKDGRIPTKYEKIPTELEEAFILRQRYTLGILLLTRGMVIETRPL
jgi:hypothetical protein